MRGKIYDFLTLQRLFGGYFVVVVVVLRCMCTTNFNGEVFKVRLDYFRAYTVCSHHFGSQVAVNVSFSWNISLVVFRSAFLKSGSIQYQGVRKH